MIERFVVYLLCIGFCVGVYAAVIKGLFSVLSLPTP